MIDNLSSMCMTTASVPNTEKQKPSLTLLAVGWDLNEMTGKGTWSFLQSEGTMSAEIVHLDQPWNVQGTENRRVLQPEQKKPNRRGRSAADLWCKTSRKSWKLLVSGTHVQRFCSIGWRCHLLPETWWFQSPGKAVNHWWPRGPWQGSRTEGTQGGFSNVPVPDPERTHC